jgi:hypothetical protein
MPFPKEPWWVRFPLSLSRILDIGKGEGTRGLLVIPMSCSIVIDKIYLIYYKILCENVFNLLQTGGYYAERL